MVSVIIVNYNTFQLTSECIRSVIKKTVGIRYEIILVDNASVECDSNLFLDEFPEITLIKSVVNLGFAGGNNLGISKATGEYILLLNSDTELMNDAISIAYGAMQQDKKIGALTGKLIYPDGRIQPSVGVFPSLKNECIELFRRSKFESIRAKSIRLKGDLLDYTKDSEGDWIWGTFFMFKNDILKGFPNNKLHEDFFLYYEDVLWCYHIKKKLKLTINYIPGPIIMHHLSASTPNKDSEEIYLNKILPNEYEFLKKTKGVFYTFLFYAVKSMHQISLCKKHNFNRGVYYVRFLMKKIG